METVIIVIHLMVVVALIAVVLLQRSEGGALGIGGGGNAFMSVRGQGNILTKATAILAFAFFVTSIGLTILNRVQAPPSSILDQVPAVVAPVSPSADGTVAPGAATGGGILDELNAFTGQEAPGTAAPAPASPQVPTSQ
jgi:preprotein translocase subunit SecG